MKICGIEVNRVSLIEDYFLILKYYCDSALEDKIEFLTRMAYKLCRLIGWFKCDYFRINKISDSVTGLETIPNKQKLTIYSNDIYDLQGRKITNKPLQRGFYIQNGRKVVNDE